MNPWSILMRLPCVPALNRELCAVLRYNAGIVDRILSGRSASMMPARRLFILVLLMLALALPAAAADEPTAVPAAASDVPAASEPAFVAGAGTTMLLLGIGAVVAVAGIALLRENARSE
jgi:hypothetical protein